MSIEFTRDEVNGLSPKIAVVGVGGAGGNAIGNMIEAEVQGVEFIVANTDAQALNNSAAATRIQLGEKITEGLGAGSRPEIGKAAAEETIQQIEEALDGCHMCFIAAGMGGGTGTGAAPVIAEAARKKGILTVGVVTKPFSFEGSRRAKAAEAGIEELQQHVDTLIVIPNQNLFLIANPDTTFKDAFKMADEVLQQGVRGITDLMVMPGLINLDFADVRSVMEEMGKAMMGTGEAVGDDRAREAAEKAIANPLLDGVSMQGAKGVIISITGGEDVRLMEVDEAANHIKELVDPDANIIIGSAFNNELDGVLRVSVVATGIEAASGAGARPEPAKVFAFPSAVESRDEGDDQVTANEPVQEDAPKPTVAPLAKDEAVETEMTAEEDAEEISLDPPAAAETTPEITVDEPVAEAAPVRVFDDSSAGDTAGREEPIAETPAPRVFSDSSDTAPKPRSGEPRFAPRPSFTVRAAGEEPRTVSSASEASAKAAQATDGSDEELLLDVDNIVAEDQPETSSEGSRKWISEESEKEARKTAKPAGGTLFERMSNIARGAAKVDPEGEKKAAAGGDSLDIPKFLNNQNNQ